MKKSYMEPEMEINVFSAKVCCDWGVGSVPYGEDRIIFDPDLEEEM